MEIDGPFLLTIIGIAASCETRKKAWCLSAF